MAKKEKAAVIILKSRIATDIDNDDIRTAEYDKAIKYLICAKNLKTAYEKLNLGKDHSAENKTLLLKLLDLQIDIALQLDAVDNRQACRETVDSLRENLSDIVSFSFDITEILGPDFNNYSYYITRTLFVLNENVDGKEACARVIRRAMVSLDYSKHASKNPILKDFLYSILIALLTYSVSSGDMGFLDVAREYYSDKSYGLSKEYNTTLLFSLVSMYLYYICEIEASVPIQIKETIRNSICSNNNIIDKCVIYSWANLYHIFSSNAAVQYDEFMRIFINNEYSFDYMLLNAGAHWVSMDEGFAFRWYVVNLLNKSTHPVDDYSLVFGKELDDGTTYQLKRLYDDCYKDGNVFSEPYYMKKMLSFYNATNNKELSLYLIVEEYRHTLFNYLTSIKSRVIIDEAHKLEHNNEQTLVTKIKTKVMSSLNKEWGLNKGLEVKSDKKYLNVYVEKSDAINFEDELIEYFKRAMFSLIRVY